MSMLWMLPVLIFSSGAIVLAVLAGRWRAEVARLQVAYAAMSSVRDESGRLAEDLQVARVQAREVAGNARLPALRTPWRR